MSENSSLSPAREFSTLRAALWPVHSHELKKFLPMCFIMFCILFDYSILRNTKDALVITAPGSGPEILSSLKFYLVMPMAVLFVVLYTKLANAFSREVLFVSFVGVFITFFLAFAFIIYPNLEAYHPSLELVEQVKAAYPRFQAVIPVWGVWTFSLFYMMSELWGSVMLSLLFWQYANDIIRTEEAKRFYALFGLVANFALLVAGDLNERLSDIKDTLPEGVDPWGVSLKYLTMAVAVSGIVAILLYLYLNRIVLQDPRYAPQETGKKKKSKPKLSVGESFKYIFTNPYVGLIALLVIGYGISINLIEVVWKYNIKLVYPDSNDYNAFMGKFTKLTGLTTILLIMLTKGIVRRFGWFWGAIITPMITIITGGLFFSFIFAGDVFDSWLIGLGISVPFAAMWVGAVQNFLTKGTKYSNFDPTKEMAYIPLDPELKSKGKAAVDVIGGRLGKAGGSAVQQILFFGLGTKEIMVVAPYLAGVVALVVGAWALAASALSKRYNALLLEKKSKA